MFSQFQQMSTCGTLIGYDISAELMASQNHYVTRITIFLVTMTTFMMFGYFVTKFARM
jgi:hypothetical protein